MLDVSHGFLIIILYTHLSFVFLLLEYNVIDAPCTGSSFNNETRTISLKPWPQSKMKNEKMLVDNEYVS